MLIQIIRTLYTNLGVILRQQGKVNAALSSYQYTLSIDPKHSGALYNCANILRDAKRFQEAFKLYSPALTLNPDQAMILNNLRANASGFRAAGRGNSVLSTGPKTSA
jgi:tetratricopeptide (TPR) repeat protein